MLGISGVYPDTSEKRMWIYLIYSVYVVVPAQTHFYLYTIDMLNILCICYSFMVVWMYCMYVFMFCILYFYVFLAAKPYNEFLVGLWVTYLEMNHRLSDSMKMTSEKNHFLGPALSQFASEKVLFEMH